ncbi:MAG: hypothetical protein JWN95_214 [Frankiales bacterium]|nr:hypothetical protein [Frankiales bacterium]
MTAMAGGAADKAGNQYEHLWTALRIAELLTGTATRLRPEPPGAAGQGIEFEIDEAGHTWGEQVKGSLSTNSWTINRLVKEGVLANALVQLQMGRQFRFVSAVSTTPLGTLCERSRRTTGVDEFKASLSEDQQHDFVALVAAWAVSEEDAWKHLKSVHVEHEPQDALRRIVNATYKSFFVEEPALVIAALREYCDTNLHQNLTGPGIWIHLESQGFTRRRLAGDQNAVAKLHATVERQSRRMAKSEPDIGLVPSSSASRVLAALTAEDGKQVLFIDGRAGSGKSTVVAEVARTLEAAGWFVAVARMDTLDPSITTSAKLGDEIGLGTDSPGVVLSGVADGSPALLVVDQLDAVSMYSGRIPDVFESIDEVLDELLTSGNVKVLLVVRTVDLEADPRLRRLSHQNRTDRISIDQLSEDDVRATLEAAGVQVPSSAITLSLLRTPLHLAIFLRLSAQAQSAEYPTLQDLYGRYTEELRTKIGHEVGHLDWTVITGALVDYMNDHERLSAPESVLDTAAPEEWHALESASVLVRESNLISFFHESYFDYLFARTFVASGQSLSGFLIASGQHLFRRAQTRQVLEYLLATDPGGFRSTTSSLVGSADMRSHIKEVVADVLGQIDPSPEDWTAIEAAAWSDDPAAWRLLALLSIPKWFEVVDKLGLWTTWLSDPERVERAFHQLMLAARTRPARVAGLVRPFVGVSEEWRLRLKTLVEWSIRPESVDLAIELLERGELDDARGPIAVNSDFWSIVYGLAREDVAAAARLIGAYLNRGLARSQADGSDDPFDGYLADHSQGDGVIGEVARSHPIAFLDAVLPFVVTVAQANQSHSDERLPTGSRWAFRHRGNSYTVDDSVFDAVEDALCELGRTDPPRCLDYWRVLSSADSDELRFLACRALTVAGPADMAVDWLSSDPRNFMLGWMDSPWWASRELLEAWTPTCSDDAFARVETAILAYQPSWERESPGRARYHVLSALDSDRLSNAALTELQRLEELFSDSPPSSPNPVMAHFVGSPIPEDDAANLTDSEWIEALHTHNQDQTTWQGPKPVGGARELSQVLERRAAVEPERFATLALTFDERVHSSAIDAVIRGIASKVNPNLLADGCEHAASLYRPDVGRTICFVARAMQPMTERMVTLVASFANDPDPDREWAQTKTHSGQTYYGGELDSAGLNCTRGQVADAAAVALFQSADHLDTLGPVVEQLAEDPILGVRVYAAEGVLALMNHDAERAYLAAERLLAADDALLDSHYVERLMTYLILRAPDRFAPVLSRGLAASDDIARRAGHVWAIAAMRDGIPSASPQSVAELPAAARRGVAEVFAANVADVGQRLAALFNDDDPEVRNAAANAMRQLTDVAAGDINHLIDAFLASDAFTEHFDKLIDDLDEIRGLEPELALRACEQAVAAAGAELGDIRTARSMLGQPIMRVVLSVYRQGSEDQRIRCLHIIDRLSERNSYGVREALEDER